MQVPAESGRQDLNLRPRDPQSRALAKLRHAPVKPDCRAFEEESKDFLALAGEKHEKSVDYAAEQRFGYFVSSINMRVFHRFFLALALFGSRAKTWRKLVTACWNLP